MKIAVIGAGPVGTALAEGWRAAGHEVILGSRSPEQADTQLKAAALGCAVMTIAEAAAAGDVIALTVPWGAVAETANSLGALHGKVLLDCTNPVTVANGRLGIDQPDGVSGGERVAALIPTARVVKAMNQVGFEMMRRARDLPVPPVMFVAGDDDAARAVALRLVGDLGFEGLDAGGIVQARHLEHFAMVWINQALVRGLGRAWAFAAVRAAGGQP